MSISGTFIISEMELWDSDYFNLEVPAFITIEKSGLGNFQFGLVCGELQGKVENNSERFVFTWYGKDECDDASGHGWIELKAVDSATGAICFDNGDCSSFHALMKN